MKLLTPIARILPARSTFAIAASCAGIEERLLYGSWIWYRSIGYGDRARNRLSMVRGMLPANRAVGNHLVATATSPGLRPAACSVVARARSERPRPYISAVSNQVTPPSRAARTTASTVS